MKQAYFVGKPPVGIGLSDPPRATAEKTWAKIVETHRQGGNGVSPEPWGYTETPESWPQGLVIS